MDKQRALGHKPPQHAMAEQPPSPDPKSSTRSRRRAFKKAKKVGRKAAYLTGREYLPMLLTLAFWLLAALSIGPADVARLLAATVLARAIFMLVQMNTLYAVRRRWHAGRATRRQAVCKAMLVQGSVLVALAALTAFASLLLQTVDQSTIARMLPLVALGFPARLWRRIDLRSHATMFRLYTTGSMLALGLLVWAMGWGALGYALAFGLREYAGTLAIRIIQPDVRQASRPTTDPLTFAEIARSTVISSRRLITYRLTKNILTIFGPFGNIAARTGRGLDYHNRLEPYMPHRRVGFAAFATVTAGIAIGLIHQSGEPLAMIIAAGALQLSALAASVLLWWRFLPVRDDPNLAIEEDDDD